MTSERRERRPGHEHTENHPAHRAGIVSAADDGDATERALEAAGFPPGQARELADRIREEVAAWPPPTAEQLARLRALLDMSQDEPGRGAA
jgi:transcription elongation GreA/GreB family factor